MSLPHADPCNEHVQVHTVLKLVSLKARMTKRHFPPTVFTPRWPQWSGMSQAEASRQELCCGL